MANESNDDFSIALPCGYSTYYKYIKNQPKRFFCMMCGKHFVDKEECFNMEKNRWIIKKHELANELKIYESSKKSLERIESDPEFYIEKTFETIHNDLEYRRDEMKRKVIDQIDQHYSFLIETLKKEKLNIQKDFEFEIKHANLPDTYRLKSIRELSGQDKCEIIEQNLYNFKEKNVLVDKLINSISKGLNYNLEEAENFKIQDYFGKIYCKKELPKQIESKEFECVRGFYGHFDSVKKIKIVDDNKILSASGDQTLNLWDKQTGKSITRFTGHTDVVSSFILLNDKFFATSSLDETIKLWNFSTGLCLRNLRGHIGGVLCLKYSKNGEILSGSEDKTIKTWSYDMWLKTFQGHLSGVTCLEECDNGLIISGSNDHTIKIWDPKNGACLRTLTGHKGEVLDLKLFNKDLLISCSADKTIKFWHVESGKCFRTLTGHSDSVQQISVLEDEEKLYSCSFDGTIKIWNIESGNCEQTIETHNRPLTSLEVISKDEFISGSIEGSIFLWKKK